jgi:glycosyltransferase involved in cell wall biosynthesis
MISVAIPAFKARFLADAIESVLCQTYSDFELIIVNDASPDDVRGIVDQFKDDRIRYFENQVNLGRTSVVTNWNKCLSLSAGELFVLFSDDDVYESVFLQEMVSLTLRYPGVKLFHCGVRIINEQGKTLKCISVCPEFESGISFIWHRLMNYREYFAPDFMCRTTALKEMGGFADLPQAWGTDDVTWSRLASKSGIAYTSRVLLNWRKSELNISQIGSIRGKLQAINECQQMMAEVLEKCMIESREDLDLATEARDELTSWIASRKCNQLLAGGRNGSVVSVIRASSRWLAYRRMYSLSFKILLKALLEIARSMVKMRST